MAKNNSEPSAAMRVEVMAVHGVLCGLYGCPVAYFHAMDPLSELVSSLLSHRTRNHDSGVAFKALRARFPSWAEVMEAPEPAVREAISACTWPEQKAPRLQHILREVLARAGELSLEFLGEMPVEAARAWLEALPGVGPKTSAATLNFSTLRGAAMPVDSHHYRVAVRLGWIPASLGEGKAHAVLRSFLPAEADAQLLYDHHEVMMFHGQRCCYHAKPACGRCALLERCPTGQERMGGQFEPHQTIV